MAGGGREGMILILGLSILRLALGSSQCWECLLLVCRHKARLSFGAFCVLSVVLCSHLREWSGRLAFRVFGLGFGV